MALTIRFTPGRVVAVGDIITEDVLNDLANPTVELEGTVNTSTIDDASITLPKLVTGILSADTAGRARMADGFVSAVKLASALDLSGKTLSGTPTVSWNSAIITPPPGWQIQCVSSADTAFTTITSTIPYDDTIPQNTEGTELTSLATSITPKSATNYLEITVEIPYAGAQSSAHAAALFQDSTASAIAVTWANNGTNAAALVLRMTHRMLAGTTSATTFKVRVGTIAGTNVITTNGETTRKFGGIMACRMWVREIQA